MACITKQLYRLNFFKGNSTIDRYVIARTISTLHRTMIVVLVEVAQLYVVHID